MATAKSNAHDLTQRIRQHWDEKAPQYDRAMTRVERFFVGDSRAWICRQAQGHTLEVAIGTGLNLPHYPEHADLVGIDLSPRMLDIARRRAAELGRTVALREGDAQHLPFADGEFDTVVCTLSLCAVPDLEAAVAEMRRVLRPGGRLLLLDHVRPTSRPLLWLLRGLQWGVNRFSPSNYEQFLRRPWETVRAQGFELERRERFKGGAIERLLAHRPTEEESAPTTPT